MSEKYQSKKSQIKSYKLQDKWVIWGHELHNSDWSPASYKKLYEFDTIQDFWVFFNNIRHFRDFMLFIMRGDILPIYEDTMCINGGYWSYVVPTKELSDSIQRLMIRMIGETLTDTEMYGEIVGMSVSPKGSRGVIKIWNKNKNNRHSLQLYLKDKYFLNARYTPHIKDNQDNKQDNARVQI